ncbi:protein kinase [Intrasporangium sp.]|uniref:serine/threonine-protein kinase n=1 Tax=Intrasporangium sp. TaxID=1925024 RepID=UPI0033659F12
MSADDVVIAGRYVLLERIGLGGMGSVWRAQDERLQRTVAVKLLHLPPGASESDARVAKERAMREARHTARLHHPHAVPVFDVVEHEGQPCLVMQYLPSHTLQVVLAENGTMPIDEAALVGAEIASALSAAHAAGVVHRDIKPANILITEDGSAKITDFGISQVLGDARLTSTGMLTGTPAYLAPEVARGEPSSAASDVYSLGATLFAAVEGSPPFGTDENPMALLHRVASDPPTRPAKAGALTPVLLAMLERDPSARPSMAEATDWLQRLDLSAPPGDQPTASMRPVTTMPLPTASAGPPAPPTVPASTPPAGGLAGAAALTRSAPPPPTPEPSANSDRTDRRSRRGIAVLAALVAIAAVGFLALQALLGDGDRTPAAAPPTDSSVAKSPSPSPTTPTKRTTTTADSTPIPPASTGPSAAPSASPTTGPPERVRLVRALQDYYALLPDDTESGYARLTDRYRRTTAGSQDAYQAFWDKIKRVSIRNPSATSGGRVEATITYTFDDGRVVEERTAYRLVEQEDALRIDSSTVLASRQR